MRDVCKILLVTNNSNVSKTSARRLQDCGWGAARLTTQSFHVVCDRKKRGYMNITIRDFFGVTEALLR